MKAFLHTRFAHRGYHCAERLIPENSIPAFQAALDRHYGIELDLHLCKDNQLVVFHDDNLKRICGVNGRIEEYTYDELQNFHLLDTTEKILSLLMY
ncbi:MAG: glycerophosphodiester phosphodiesterase family protein [Lachnoclostridium sp.]